MNKNSFFVQDVDKVREISVEAFIKFIAEEKDVASRPDVPAEDLIAHILRSVLNDEPITQDLLEDGHSKLFQYIERLVREDSELREANRLRQIAIDEKIREEAKATKAEIKRRREIVEGSMRAKATRMRGEGLKREIRALQDSMPHGVEIALNSSGNGIGISLPEGEELSEEQFGDSLGALFASSSVAEAMAQSRAFLIGGLCNEAVKQGLYRSKIQAGKSISDTLRGIGINISGKTIETYARTDSRINIEYRNNSAPDSAYISLAQSKLPKQENGESDAAYESRIERYVEKRNEIAEKIGNEELSTVRDVKKAVEGLEIDHGVREKKDPNQKPRYAYLTDYFHATHYLENFLGKHKEGTVITISLDGEKTEYSECDLKEIRDIAISQLSPSIKSNVGGDVFTHDDLIEGTCEIEAIVTYVDMEGKTTVKKDENGEDLVELKTFNAYPPNIFQ